MGWHPLATDDTLSRLPEDSTLTYYRPRFRPQTEENNRYIAFLKRKPKKNLQYKKWKMGWSGRGQRKNSQLKRSVRAKSCADLCKYLGHSFRHDNLQRHGETALNPSHLKTCALRLRAKKRQYWQKQSRRCGNARKIDLRRMILKSEERTTETRRATARRCSPPWSQTRASAEQYSLGKSSPSGGVGFDTPFRSKFGRLVLGCTEADF